MSCIQPAFLLMEKERRIPKMLCWGSWELIDKSPLEQGTEEGHWVNFHEKAGWIQPNICDWFISTWMVALRKCDIFLWIIWQIVCYPVPVSRHVPLMLELPASRYLQTRDHGMQVAISKNPVYQNNCIQLIKTLIPHTQSAEISKWFPVYQEKTATLEDGLCGIIALWSLSPPQSFLRLHPQNLPEFPKPEMATVIDTVKRSASFLQKNQSNTFLVWQIIIFVLLLLLWMVHNHISKYV